ncbi:hypothetical protein ACIOWF_06820 [Cellulosimicrobium cellulans]|uniref:hypothetical protein n=1 Tax=Cellulosimicrobium cellulans TaxID=1710 RepID=UPI0038212BE0
MDPDNEILDALRAAIEDQFGRWIGPGISTTEVARVVTVLEQKGVVLLRDRDVPQAPELVAPVLEAGPLVTVNLNVSTTSDMLPSVLDTLRDRGLAS